MSDILSTQGPNITVQAVEFHTSLWTTADRLFLITTVATGALLATIGSLGMLSHQGIHLGYFNRLNLATHAPKQLFITTGVSGGALLLMSTAMCAIKALSNSQERHRVMQLITSQVKVIQQPKSKDSRLESKDILQKRPLDLQQLNGNSCQKALFRVGHTYHALLTHSDGVHTLKLFGSKKAQIAAMKGFHEVHTISPKQTRVMCNDQSVSQHVIQRVKGEGKGLAIVGATLFTLALPAFALPFVFPFKYAIAVQSFALAIIISASHTIISDQLAAHQSQEYFKRGHKSWMPLQFTTQSDSPTVQGLVSALKRYFAPALVTATLFATASTVTNRAHINPLYVTPIFVAGSVASIAYSRAKAQAMEREWKQKENEEDLAFFFSKSKDRLLKRRFPNPPEFSGQIHVETNEGVALDLATIKHKAAYLGAATQQSQSDYLLAALTGVVLITLVASRILIAKTC